MSDSVNEAYLQGVFIHECLSYFFVPVYIWYIYVMLRRKSFLDMNRRIYLTAPITIFLLSVAIFTGLFTLAMRNFAMDFGIFYMIVVCLIFLAGEIYRMVSLKRAKTSRENMQRYVKKFCIMYMIFILLYISILVLYI